MKEIFSNEITNHVIERHTASNKTKQERDLQQEREDTSLKYFKVFFNYIAQFSRSILLYLAPSWSI